MVKRAEAKLLHDVEAGLINHEYLPIGGDREFVALSNRLALGADSPAIAAHRVRLAFRLAESTHLPCGAEGAAISESSQSLRLEVSKPYLALAHSGLQRLFWPSTTL